MLKMKEKLIFPKNDYSLTDFLSLYSHSVNLSSNYGFKYRVKKERIYGAKYWLINSTGMIFLNAWESRYTIKKSTAKLQLWFSKGYANLPHDSSFSRMFWNSLQIISDGGYALATFQLAIPSFIVFLSFIKFCLTSSISSRVSTTQSFSLNEIKAKPRFYFLL